MSKARSTKQNISIYVLDFSDTSLTLFVQYDKRIFNIVDIFYLPLNMTKSPSLCGGD
ncbi:hypothetical protein [Helicobacter sp. T3_23-1056]